MRNAIEVVHPDIDARAFALEFGGGLALFVGLARVGRGHRNPSPSQQPGRSDATTTEADHRELAGALGEPTSHQRGDFLGSERHAVSVSAA
jgi:hypothetical protein